MLAATPTTSLAAAYYVSATAKEVISDRSAISGQFAALEHNIRVSMKSVEPLFIEFMH